MNVIQGIYKNGMIELIEKPDFPEPVEVVVVFPEKPKIIKQICGMFKDATFDYDAIEAELKELSRRSEAHLLSEWAEEQ
jgi:hypothetical protein